MINRTLSYAPEYLPLIAALNQCGDVPKLAHFVSLHYGLPRTPRSIYSKGIFKKVTCERIDNVMAFYKYNRDRALEAIELLSEEQLTTIDKRMTIGGRPGDK